MIAVATALVKSTEFLRPPGPATTPLKSTNDVPAPSFIRN